MADLSTIGTFIIGSGGLLGSCIAIYMARANRKKTEAESIKTSSEARKLDTEAAKLDDERYRDRETFWREEVEKVEKKFERKIDELEQKVAGLQLLIEGHIPWDWEALRKLKMNDIDQRDPPTLIWVEERREE